jgi:hypothetical protein
MPQPLLASATEADLPRLAEIQRAAFAQDPFLSHVCAGVPEDALHAWRVGVLAAARAPPGHRLALVCARRADTGAILGWAKWLFPDTSAAAVFAAEPLARAPTPLPVGVKIDDLVGFEEDIGAAEKSLMGDRAYWCQSTFSSARHSARSDLTEHLCSPC